MNTKRMIALFCAAVTAVGCTACGKPGTKQKGPEVSLDNSYSAVELEMLGLNDIYNICSVGESYLISGWDKDYKTSHLLYDPKDDSVRKVALNHYEQAASKEVKEDEYVCEPSIVSAVTTSAGDVYIFYTDYQYDKEIYEELGVTVEKYDTDMNLKDTVTLGDAFNKENPNSLNGIVIDGSDRLFVGTYSSDGKPQIGVFDLDFKQIGTVDLQNAQYTESMFQTGDGKIVCCYSDMNYDQKYGTVNTETLQFDPVEVEGMPSWAYGSTACTGDYDFCAYDSQGIYGIRIGQPAEKMLDWINSDFMGDYVRKVQPMKDGRVLVACSTPDYDSCQLYVCKERDKSELNKIKMLSLAVFYPSNNLSQAIMAYNRSHDDVRIVMKRYESGDDYEADLERFKNDLTSGMVADLICTDSMPFESLANMGLFLDLNELMDADADFNRDDYFDNYFRAMEYGGKLYRVGGCFNVETLAAKEKFIDVSIPMTMEDFRGIIDKLPASMTAFEEMTRYSVSQGMIMNNLGCFLDVEKGTCDFDNQQFIELLEFCNTFPEQVVDYDNMEDSDWDKYWQNRDRLYRDDKALFCDCWLSSVSRYHEILQGNFGGQPVVLCGYPSVDGTGNGGKFYNNYTISISAGTSHKQEAWDFVRTMLSEEVGNEIRWSFPVNRNAFANVAAKDCEPQTYQDENGNTVTSPVYYGGYGMEEPMDIGYPTQEEVQALQTYIENITVIYGVDTDVYNIINEEMEMFFAGDQSAADCAKMIQSRVGLYISESH